MEIAAIIDDLIEDLSRLRFGPPVTHVYNPLEYARGAYEQYLRRYGTPPKQVVLVGMNPGPWGMAQTGVPFGEVQAVKEWLGIQTPVKTPSITHPKRPVQGFGCKRSEISGKRLWGWAMATFGTPSRFFKVFFVANYCPLLFIEETGRNRTPDKLPTEEKRALFTSCDRELRRTIQWLKPRYVVGVGEFARGRCVAALSGIDVTIGKITHPSPANPKANRGWASLIREELAGLGIEAFK
jgi:single-strand selective monofunctional uracil DNA glycosylase